MDFPLFISVLLFNLMGWDFVGNVGMYTEREREREREESEKKGKLHKN